MVVGEVDACIGDFVIAMFHIAVCRKPVDGTVSANVMRYGVGGINIDGCRVGTTPDEIEKMNDNRKAVRTIRAGAVAQGYGMRPEGLSATTQSPLGRFPANLIHDGSDEVVVQFPANSPSGGSSTENSRQVGLYDDGLRKRIIVPRFDSGSAARFFKRFQV